MTRKKKSKRPHRHSKPVYGVVRPRRHLGPRRTYFESSEEYETSTQCPTKQPNMGASEQRLTIFDNTLSTVETDRDLPPPSVVEEMVTNRMNFSQVCNQMSDVEVQKVIGMKSKDVVINTYDDIHKLIDEVCKNPRKDSTGEVFLLENVGLVTEVHTENSDSDRTLSPDCPSTSNNVVNVNRLQNESVSDSESSSGQPSPDGYAKFIKNLNRNNNQREERSSPQPSPSPESLEDPSESLVCEDETSVRKTQRDITCNAEQVLLFSVDEEDRQMRDNLPPFQTLWNSIPPTTQHYHRNNLPPMQLESVSDIVADEELEVEQEVEPMNEASNSLSATNHLLNSSIQDNVNKNSTQEETDSSHKSDSSEEPVEELIDSKLDILLYVIRFLYKKGRLHLSHVRSRPEVKLGFYFQETPLPSEEPTIKIIAPNILEISVLHNHIPELKENKNMKMSQCETNSETPVTMPATVGKSEISNSKPTQNQQNHPMYQSDDVNTKFKHPISNSFKKTPTDKNSNQNGSWNHSNVQQNGASKFSSFTSLPNIEHVEEFLNSGGVRSTFLTRPASLPPKFQELAPVLGQSHSAAIDASGQISPSKPNPIPSNLPLLLTPPSSGGTTSNSPCFSSHNEVVCIPNQGTFLEDSDNTQNGSSSQTEITQELKLPNKFETITSSNESHLPTINSYIIPPNVLGTTTGVNRFSDDRSLQNLPEPLPSLKRRTDLKYSKKDGIVTEVSVGDRMDELSQKNNKIPRQDVPFPSFIKHFIPNDSHMTNLKTVTSVNDSLQTHTSSHSCFGEGFTARENSTAPLTYNHDVAKQLQRQPEMSTTVTRKIPFLPNRPEISVYTSTNEDLNMVQVMNCEYCGRTNRVNTPVRGTRQRSTRGRMSRGRRSSSMMRPQYTPEPPATEPLQSFSNSSASNISSAIHNGSVTDRRNLMNHNKTASNIIENKQLLHNFLSREIDLTLDEKGDARSSNSDTTNSSYSHNRENTNVKLPKFNTRGIQLQSRPMGTEISGALQNTDPPEKVFSSGSCQDNYTNPSKVVYSTADNRKPFLGAAHEGFNPYMQSFGSNSVGPGPSSSKRCAPQVTFQRPECIPRYGEFMSRYPPPAYGWPSPSVPEWHGNSEFDYFHSYQVRHPYSAYPPPTHPGIGRYYHGPYQPHPGFQKMPEMKNQSKMMPPPRYQEAIGQQQTNQAQGYQQTAQPVTSSATQTWSRSFVGSQTAPPVVYPTIESAGLCHPGTSKPPQMQPFVNQSMFGKGHQTPMYPAAEATSKISVCETKYQPSFNNQQMPGIGSQPQPSMFTGMESTGKIHVGETHQPPFSNQQMCIPSTSQQSSSQTVSQTNYQYPTNTAASPYPTQQQLYPPISEQSSRTTDREAVQITSDKTPVSQQQTLQTTSAAEHSANQGNCQQIW